MLPGRSRGCCPVGSGAMKFYKNCVSIDEFLSVYFLYCFFIAQSFLYLSWTVVVFLQRRQNYVFETCKLEELPKPDRCALPHREGRFYLRAWSRQSTLCIFGPQIPLLAQFPGTSHISRDIPFSTFVGPPTVSNLVACSRSVGLCVFSCSWLENPRSPDARFTLKVCIPAALDPKTRSSLVTGLGPRDEPHFLSERVMVAGECPAKLEREASSV